MQLLFYFLTLYASNYLAVIKTQNFKTSLDKQMEYFGPLVFGDGL